MGNLDSKPAWAEGFCPAAGKLCNGCLAEKLSCDYCNYETHHQEYLEKHKSAYHNDSNMILYMACEGSLDARNTLIDEIETKGFEDIDCTGGQAAFEDGDLNHFGKALVKAARKHNIKLYQVSRMKDPGMGLIFPDWWFKAGVEAGLFEEYSLPDDVLVQVE